jgi:hypothetical protein
LMGVMSAPKVVTSLPGKDAGIRGVLPSAREQALGPVDALYLDRIEDGNCNLRSLK